MTIERQTVHISDELGRMAMWEHRNFGSDDGAVSLTRYVYSNHLQSASLELNEVGEIISYEEYHPYGTTAYQATNTSINAVAKRYRYTGKERDEESGLYYHGARYYIPWLCRWTAVDPMESKYAGMSPYNYAFNNPVMFNDPSGADPGDEGENIILPTVEIIGQRMSSVDGANSYYRDMAIHNIMNVSQVELNRKFKSEQELRQNIYDNQRFIGSDGNGQFYNTSIAQVKQQQFEQSQQVFDALRGGPFSSLGYHMFGERGALSFSRLDQVAMAAYFSPNLEIISNANLKASNKNILFQQTFSAKEILPNNIVENQSNFLTKSVPGLSFEQANFIISNTYNKGGVSTTFGGSRIRGNYSSTSDLDVGFIGLSTSQAGKIIKSNNKFIDRGWLQLETTLIVPGNKTSNIQLISTPQEFFQRSGIRSGNDLKSNQPYGPSGSITTHNDGNISIIDKNGLIFIFKIMK